MAANILHAQPNPISQTIAAWPPVALLLTVEMISRVPVHRRHLAAARILAASAISAIAAWVSYWHMTGVANRYGEAGATPYLLPASVDGLIIVASVSLVELAGRISTLEANPTPQPRPEPPHPATDGQHHTDEPGPTVPAPSPTETAPHTDNGANGSGGRRPATEPSPARPASPATSDTAQPPTDTVAAVAYWHRQAPDMHPADIADKVQRSERHVRRILKQLDLPPEDATNARNTTAPGHHTP
jgi:hypothetical protein